MYIKNTKLPTEGAHFAKTHFLPGKIKEVENSFGKDLIKRKGFVECSKVQFEVQEKGTEVKEPAEQTDKTKED